MNDGFFVYLLYCALTAHFSTEKYDFHRYRGEVSIKSRESYEKRADKMFFERVARYFKQREYVPFIASNMVENPYKIWIGDLVLDFDKSLERYSLCKEIFSDIRYHFQVQLNYLMSEYQKITQVISPTNLKGEVDFPQLFYLMLRKDISPETYTILSKVVPFITGLEKKLDEKLFSWKALNLKYLKYQTFILFDKVDILSYIPKKFIV